MFIFGQHKHTASAPSQNVAWSSSPLKDEEPDLKGLHKYRVGDYRVLLWVNHEADLLTLYGVRHRREIYDLLR